MFISEYVAGALEFGKDLDKKVQELDSINYKKTVMYALVFDPVDIHMDEATVALSDKLSALFSMYINSLELRHPATGEALTLEPESGRGSYLDYMIEEINRSATAYLTPMSEEARQEHLAQRPWLSWEGSAAVVPPEKYQEYIHSVSREKPCPSFDGFDCEITENSLFGTEDKKGNHFDDALEEVSGHTGAYAVPEEIRKNIELMNPMKYIQKLDCDIAPHFYIRVGALDSNHAYSAAMNLALKLKNSGRCRSVNFKIDWMVNHDGDYSLDEMFGWVRQICR